MIDELLHRAGLGHRVRGRSPLARHGADRRPSRSSSSPSLRFPTPSGKIEIASARAEADGHPRVPLPLADPRPRDGRLRLLSPASPWLLNDSFANDRQAREAARRRRRSPCIRTTRPSAACAAATRRCSPTRPAASALRARRLSGRSPRRGAARTRAAGRSASRTRANVNALNPGEKADMGESTAVHGVEVAVSRV